MKRKFLITNKKGAMGESMLMIYRLLLITFIAFIVLGLTSWFYDYQIDVRDAEARILAKQITNCLISDSFINLDNLKGNEKNLLDYCDIKNADRFYAKVVFFQDSYILNTFEQGDSGAKWVKDILDKIEGDKLEKYKPGYAQEGYEVILNSKNGGEVRSFMNVEVVVRYE